MVGLRSRRTEGYVWGERRHGERSRMGSSMDRMGSSKNRTGCRMRSRRDRIMRRSKRVISVNEG
jgi:hypothetical protein